MAIKTLTLAILMTTTAHAADWGKWVRRATVAGACAMSMVDLRTTRSALSRGAVETNPLLSGGGVGRMVGMKVGVCVGQASVEEWAGRGAGRHDRLWIGVNLVQIAGLAVVARRNTQMGRGRE
jgi:hypothetical protein